VARDMKKAIQLLKFEKNDKDHLCCGHFMEWNMVKLYLVIDTAMTMYSKTFIRTLQGRDII